MRDAERILRDFVAGVDLEGLGAYGAHVSVGGSEASHRWRSDDRENIYSVSKGLCALAVGMAVDDGLVQVDSTVGDLLPEMDPGGRTPEVTLKHLLTMSSGIDFAWFADEAVPWKDLAREILTRPARRPGSVFQYSDASTYLAMRMLAAAVGDVRDWLIPRLFEPLEIHNPQWHRCPLGYIMGGSGLQLRTVELARIGRLLADGGAWQGQQLVSSGWVQLMRAPWSAPATEAPGNRYGMGTWGGPGECWQLSGRYGQYVIIDPVQAAVVTVTAHEEFRGKRFEELALEALRGGTAAEFMRSDSPPSLTEVTR